MEYICEHICQNSPKMVLHVTINGSSLLSGDERDLMGWGFTESVFCLLE